MRFAAVFVLVVAMLSGCGGPERRTVGLDVDVFLHPGSSDLTDVLLQTGIAKRLADDDQTQNGIIHVRVVNLMVVLSGAVRSEAIKNRAEDIAESTVVRVNEASIQTNVPINNRIEVQR